MIDENEISSQFSPISRLYDAWYQLCRYDPSELVNWMLDSWAEFLAISHPDVFSQLLTSIRAIRASSDPQEIDIIEKSICEPWSDIFWYGNKLGTIADAKRLWLTRQIPRMNSRVMGFLGGINDKADEIEAFLSCACRQYDLIRTKTGFELPVLRS